MKQSRFKQTEIGMVPEDWSVIKLGDLGEVNRGRSRHRPRWAPELYGGPYPFIQTGDIKASGGRIVRYSQTYSEKGLAQSRMWPAGTMCITIAANIAETGVLTFPACFPDSIVGFIADGTKCNVYFIEHMFRYLRNKIQHEASGSVQDNINLETLDRLGFPLPPLPEQNAIEAILSSLDNKIALNNKINKNLEAIGKAIFKHWFVDFEFPNEEGKPYKSSGGEMVYNEELGKEIPEGWRVGTVNEIVVQSKDQILPYEHPETIYNHFSIEAYDSGMKPLSQLGSEILSNKFVVHKNTILVSKLNPRIQRIWSVINVKENSICSTEFLVFKPKNNLFCYFYNQLSSSSVKKNLIQMARGTSGSHQRISVDDVLNIDIAIPSQNILELFEKIVFTNLTKIEQNNNSQLELADIRDSLLPKLMSGKIRVPVEVN